MCCRFGRLAILTLTVGLFLPRKSKDVREIIYEEIPAKPLNGSLVDAVLAGAFASFDANDDGSVTVAEFNARIKKFDADGDGFITKKEFRKSEEEMLKKVEFESANDCFRPVCHRREPTPPSRSTISTATSRSTSRRRPPSSSCLMQIRT